MEKECGAGSKEAAIIIECEEYLKRGSVYEASTRAGCLCSACRK